MFYLLPTAVVGLLGYMLWMTAFRLRRDRVEFARERIRGRFRRERLREPLAGSFALLPERPEWDSLLSRLGGSRRPGSGS